MTNDDCPRDDAAIHRAIRPSSSVVRPSSPVVGPSSSVIRPSPPNALSALPDLVRPGLEILFVGINPGLKSARVGHYYAGPGNLFWRCLHESGLVPMRLRPEDDGRLPAFGIGITDCVSRPSRSAMEVRRDEFAR